MNTTNLSHGPLAASASHAWHGLAARWSAHLEMLRRRREAETLADLDEQTLRDIGAPERWVGRAIAQREAEQQRLLALRQWRNG